MYNKKESLAFARDVLPSGSEGKTEVDMRKRTALIIFIGIIVFSFCVTSVFAAERENKVVTFFKKLINWPLNITKKGAETVGRTAQKPIMATTKTASSSVETVTGKPEKIKDVVTEPVKGAADTAVTAVEGTVTTPIEATKETFGEEKK